MKYQKVKRKLLATMLSVPVFVITLAGCSSSQTEETAANTGADQTDEVQDSSSEELESGKVTLRVWAEEANFEAMNIMIDNFKKEYAGQADFDYYFRGVR